MVLAVGIHSMMPTIMIVSMIPFLLITGLIIYIVVSKVRRENKNDKMPRLSVQATVVAKRMEVSTYGRRYGRTNTMGTSRTTYYATFQVLSGDRMELMVETSEYGMLAEGDWGTLEFQGSRFLNFIRK